MLPSPPKKHRMVQAQGSKLEPGKLPMLKATSRTAQENIQPHQASTWAGLTSIAPPSTTASLVPAHKEERNVLQDSLAKNVTAKARYNLPIAYIYVDVNSHGAFLDSGAFIF